MLNNIRFKKSSPQYYKVHFLLHYFKWKMTTPIDIGRCMLGSHTYFIQATKSLML